jgi:hypothetical protein
MFSMAIAKSVQSFSVIGNVIGISPFNAIHANGRHHDNSSMSAPMFRPYRPYRPHRPDRGSCGTLRSSQVHCNSALCDDVPATANT